MIERQLLNRIITEQKLSLTGVIDPSSARQLGKILGVDAIVSGTITDLSKKLRINARLISTETGEIFAVAATEIQKDDEVVGLMTQGALGSNPGTADSSSQSVNDKQTRSQSGAASPRKSTPAKIELQAFNFEFNLCKLSGTYLYCYLWVTNNVADRDLTLFTNESTMVDDSGNKKEPSLAAISNHGGEYLATNLLVSGVRTWAVLEFREVNPETKRVSLLVFGFRVGNSDFSVRCRNVAIDK